MITVPEEHLNPSQIKFLDSTTPYVLFSGGYGSGKSAALIVKLLQLKGLNGKLPGLLMAQSFGELYTNLVEPLLMMLEASLPEHLVPRVVGRGGSHPQLKWADGGVTHLRSAERPSGYAGLNVAYLLGDEIRYWSKAAYDVAIARVRIKTAPHMQRCFTSTPVMNWMADEFNTGKAFRELIKAPTKENAHNLPPDYIDGLRASYSKRLVRALLDGEFTILEGSVYEDFDPNFRVSPWFVDFEPTTRILDSRKVYLAVDPGYRRSSYQWIVEVSPLNWVVFDEMQPENCSDERAAQMVNDRGWPIDEIWIDPAADATQSAMGFDALAAIRQIKCRSNAPIRAITGMFRDIQFGVDKLRVLLGGELQPMRIKFARRLEEIERGKERGIVRSLGSYRYPETKDGRAVVDTPLKDGVNDHDCDALRYWAVGRWMCEPQLRALDPKLRASQAAGYKIAA